MQDEPVKSIYTPQKNLNQKEWRKFPAFPFLESADISEEDLLCAEKRKQKKRELSSRYGSGRRGRGEADIIMSALADCFCPCAIKSRIMVKHPQANCGRFE